MDYDQLRRLVFKAQSYGALIRPTQLTAWEWDVGAYCDDPKSVTHHARKIGSADASRLRWRTNPGSLTLHMSGLPCRRCRKCLRVRADLWAARASTELYAFPRTWFVTLTINPHVQSVMWMRELAAKEKRGYSEGDFPDDKWNLRAAGASKLLTLYLKRVRKPLDGEPRIHLRYLAVTERHKSGLPHIHVLMHDVAGNLTYRRITERWEAGFSSAKLVDDEDEGSALYLTKYVSKEVLTRVRASIHYGSGVALYRRSALAAILRDASVTPT